ncbi:hypothetical protein EDD21DRAFT_393128 [Dissophora ornata]|nr:hypothetical protein EDD21DRAFT_393128 [Dissophora ornata]
MTPGHGAFLDLFFLFPCFVYSTGFCLPAGHVRPPVGDGLWACKGLSVQNGIGVQFSPLLSPWSIDRVVRVETQNTFFFVRHRGSSRRPFVCLFCVSLFILLL